MRFHYKFVFILLILAMLADFKTPLAEAQDIFTRDKSRKVLSFADELESILPSVVQIGRLQVDSNGQLRLSGTGSGAVINAENGYIITNSHVVSEGQAFAVNLPDGRVVKAKLIGEDPPTDIAILQADDLQVDAVKISDSDNLRVGDLVFAIGYPLGLDQSLSMGVISGLGRAGRSDGLQDFIQTDAAINSGNSGGPLLNSRGSLVGINTAILSRSGENNGIGFSVPANIAMQVTEQLIQYGEVKRGSLGIDIAKVSEKASEIVGIDHWDGALIVSVNPDGPAAKAGLQPGDVIVEYERKTVKTPNSLRAWIGVAPIKKTVKIAYIRENGKKQVADVTVGNTTSSLVRNFSELGASIRPTKTEDNLPDKIKGVYLYEVKDNTPAARAGLRVGDVVVAVNNQKATTMQLTDRMVTQSSGRVRLIVYRLGTLFPVILET